MVTRVDLFWLFKHARDKSLSEPFRFLLIANINRTSHKKYSFHLRFRIFVGLLALYLKRTPQWNLGEKFWETYSDPIPRVMDTLFLLIISLAPWAGKMNKSCAVIGYLSGQDRAILPARDYPTCLARKISPKANIKSFIDEAFLVKMAGYWSRSFFASL